MGVKFKNRKSNITRFNHSKEKLGEGGSAVVYLLRDKRGNKIAKKVYKTDGHSCFNRHFDNEVKVLEALYGEKHFPRLLFYDKRKYTIYMTFCGERIRGDIAPKDWKKQLLEIIDILDKHNLSHNSSSLNNTCVKDGQLYFIDFASTGDYRPRKRNINKEIVLKSKNIKSVFNSKKTREIRKGRSKSKKA